MHRFLLFRDENYLSINQVTDHRLHLKYGFMKIAYNKHEMNGELDFPSCLEEFIDDFVHKFPISSAPNFLQIHCQALEYDLFKNA